ncbi:sugar transferase [Streptococcus suis]|uniref:Sugar transferase n=1 Tax=Streptococcus suis TaxID=1307 RepID=A0A4T2GN19_STRSU|nr:sugar transferase [Streptococcus suis]MBM7268746.1 sugar transferase [Streptococcus suis]MBM7269540.1 sugar transferase [Streptococcus suis]TII00303.1 sugar transferase [Streptococcus suis]TII00801.1 sugar transferase [Streptococcus suis]
MENSSRRQSNLLFVQLAVVILVGMVIVELPYTDMTRSDLIILGLIHFFAYYSSRMEENFWNRDAIRELEKVVIYNVIFSLSLSFIAFMLEENFIISRWEVIYFLVLNTMGIYLINLVLKGLHQSTAANRLLVLTVSERLNQVLTNLQTLGLKPENIAGIVLMDKEPKQVGDLHWVQVEDAIHFAKTEAIDKVFINVPSSQTDLDLAYWISEFEVMGIEVNVHVNLYDLDTFGSKKIRHFGNFHIISFSSNFYSISHVILKRIVDIIGSLVGLVLFGIAYLILAPIIKKDGGPVIFAQDRVGRNGRVFKFYKFRSMSQDAEERKSELLELNQMQGGMFKMDNDPRITKIGHFIRKTSLDELPQFYNVLKGDMSLVGTRPPTVDEFEAYTPSQKRRLSFKPGITGLWQVSGRSDITNFDEVVKLDLAYIDNWTIWSDVKIILLTIKVILFREGAK